MSEPFGLGTVVADRAASVWVRVPKAKADSPGWAGADREGTVLSQWDDIEDPRIIHEGWL